MKLKLYSIRDTISEIFNKPFCANNDASAIRAFANAMAENPDKDDFNLYYLGEYYDQSGEIVPHEVIRIYNGTDVKKAPVVEMHQQQLG